jgi:hypothetical protein
MDIRGNREDKETKEGVPYDKERNVWLISH